MTLLDEILGDTPPASFALLARVGIPHVEVLAGPIVDVALLADIPLHDADGAPREVLALVPFRQLAERGYEVHDDGAPLRCMLIERRDEVSHAAALEALPAGPVDVAEVGFDVGDDDYAASVRRVIDDEIGRGEGANFVLRRDFVASTQIAPERLAPQLFRRLLASEVGAHWTFAIVTPEVVMVGASPEQHVGVEAGVVTMNPISGTYRNPDPLTGEHFLEFLHDTKEVEELFMVVDEELKMMSEVCSSGGHVQGPFLKQMSRLTHTEYLLQGTSTLDVRDILRLTMFAPTVTGSPMENACAVIARHEGRGRGYYAGVAALITPELGGGHRLDAPILIRTAYLQEGGVVRVPVGATLVRHSTPEGEVRETHTKASGVLAALGLLPARTHTAAASLAEFPGVAEALAARNERLSAFWLQDQSRPAQTPFAGLSAVVVDAEDRFATMLAHQLRYLGLTVDIVRWDAVDVGIMADAADLLVSGPGPGDPTDTESSRMRTLDALIRRRREQSRPLIAVCLSHQLLALQLGFGIRRLPAPRQGVPLSVPLFDGDATIGFYNTFTAYANDRTPTEAGVRSFGDPVTGDIYALHHDRAVSVQGHLESVLSRDGLDALRKGVALAVGAR